MPQQKIIQLFPSLEPARAEPAKKASRPAYGHSSGRKRKHFRYTDARGVSRQHTVYGATIAEAEKSKQAFLADVAASIRMEEKGRTVASWADEWLRLYKSSVGASTRKGYEIDLQHIKNALGDRLLRSVFPADLKAFIDTRAGLSASAIKKTAMTVRALFQAAMDDRLIPFNPASGLKGPKGESGSHRALKPEEQKIVEQVAAMHRFGFVVMLMLWAGLRRGEACAFDPEECVAGDDLRISHAVEWVGGNPFLKSPKTRAGTRSIPIWPALRPFLEQAKIGYAAQPSTGSDKLITLSAFDRGFESFRSACDEVLNGCTKRWQPKGHVWQSMNLRTHDLRHTWFTMLYDTGVDVKVAAAWGGHADISVTMRVYQHVHEARKMQELRKSISMQHSPGDNIGDIKKRYRLKNKQ